MRSLPRSPTWLLLAFASTAACSSDSDKADDASVEDTDGAPGDDSGADSADDTGDRSDDDDTAEPGDPDLPNGDYLMSISLAPVGGVVVQFQASLTTRRGEDGSVVVESADFRASDGSAVSAVLASAEAIPVAEDGSFVMDLGAFWLPPEFSPTGGDVEVAIQLLGQLENADSFCGAVEGEVVSFGIDMAGSTFGAVPWDDRPDASVVACGGGVVEDLPRLDAAECPTLEAGRVTGFPSGGLERQFELFVPDGPAPANGWPVVIVYHGLGGNIDDMVNTDLLPPAAERGMVVVVPQADRLGGSVAWDVVSDAGSNQDVTLFDDLLTCLSGTVPVDTDRIYATGMSNGGLMTGTLLSQRSQVLASVAPWSGGVMGSWPEEAEPIPALVVWGGEADEAVDQDFHALNVAMLDELTRRGSFVVACDHGLGHVLRSAWWSWTFDFLLAHPRGVLEGAYGEGLPEAFPDFCTIPDPG